MMEAVWLKRAIQYLILHHYKNDIGGSTYTFNINGMANSKKLILTNMF